MGSSLTGYLLSISEAGAKSPNFANILGQLKEFEDAQQGQQPQQGAQQGQQQEQEDAAGQQKQQEDANADAQ